MHAFWRRGGGTSLPGNYLITGVNIPGVSQLYLNQNGQLFVTATAGNTAPKVSYYLEKISSSPDSAKIDPVNYLSMVIRDAEAARSDTLELAHHIMCYSSFISTDTTDNVTDIEKNVACFLLELCKMIVGNTQAQCVDQIKNLNNPSDSSSIKSIPDSSSNQGDPATPVAPAAFSGSVESARTEVRNRLLAEQQSNPNPPAPAPAPAPVTDTACNFKIQSTNPMGPANWGCRYEADSMGVFKISSSGCPFANDICETWITCEGIKNCLDVYFNAAYINITRCASFYQSYQDPSTCNPIPL